MSNVVKTFARRCMERKRLYLDYGCWMADDEELTDFQVTVFPYIEERAGHRDH